MTQARVALVDASARGLAKDVAGGTEISSIYDEGCIYSQLISHWQSSDDYVRNETLAVR